jgi:hypothetical protein
MTSAERFEPDLVLHDTVAYTLVGIVSFCLCALAASRMRRICWMLVIGGAVSLSLQLANGIGLLQVPGIDPWFWERLRGWSDNPNQLALVCLVVALLAWYLADTSASFGVRLAAIVLLIPPIVVGRMSQSDTFTLALAISLPIWIAARLINWVQNDPHESSLRGSTARLLLVALPVLLLSVTPVVLTRAEVVSGFVLGLAKNAGAEAADEANLRMTLWHQAIQLGDAGPRPRAAFADSCVNRGGPFERRRTRGKY